MSSAPISGVARDADRETDCEGRGEMSNHKYTVEFRIWGDTLDPMEIERELEAVS